MARPTKLTKELQQQIGESVALGMTYSLAAASAGIMFAMGDNSAGELGTGSSQLPLLIPTVVNISVVGTVTKLQASNGMDRFVFLNGANI